MTNRRYNSAPNEVRAMRRPRKIRLFNNRNNAAITVYKDPVDERMVSYRGVMQRIKLPNGKSKFIRKWLTRNPLIRTNG